MRSRRVRPIFLYLASVCAFASVSAADTPVLDPISDPIHVGSQITLHGSGITQGSVLKVFLATAGGPVDVSGAGGLVPSSTTATSFTLTLPFPWPVADPGTQFSVGNGFVGFQLVQTDMGFDGSNVMGAVLLGNDSLGVPSVTGINGTSLSATSTDPSIGLANVETVVVPGATMTIQGGAFASSKVNIFTATGNIGPLNPSSQTSTSISVPIPANAPIGPGSVQVVNATGNFRSSNSVSVPIGALVTVTSIEVKGTTVAVHGSGFNSLAVINLFAAVSGQVINAGGFDPGGSPYLPLTIVSSTQLTFTFPVGLDPGAAYVQAINPPFIPYTTSQGDGGSFPWGMVFVPAGTFTMGSNGLYDDEEPVHAPYLSAYWIDQNDVTVDQYAACVSAGGCSAPHGVYDPSSLNLCNWGSPRAGDNPINCVDWSQGQAYCAWAGKRYPTEAEWEKAARGTDAQTYPWGEATPTCAYAVMYGGGNGCGQGFTRPVGSKPAGASPYGALDMAGNVWQWVNDWYNDTYYSVGPPTDPPGPASSPYGWRVFRGGSYINGSGLLRSSGRNRGPPSWWADSMGFRCARGA